MTAAESAGPVSVPAAARDGSRVSRVLLAEDDPDYRRLVGLALHADGCDVTEARDGPELADRLCAALERRAQPYDIVVADVHLPNGTALDVLAPAVRAGLATPIILMTGFGDEQVYLAAGWLGVSCVFRKPFAVDDLRMAVLTFARFSPRRSTPPATVA